MGSIIFKAILGMVAGAIGWAMVEPFKPSPIQVVVWGLFEVAMMTAWSSLIGASIGFHSGYMRGSKLHAIKEGLSGAFFGGVGMMIARGVTTPVVAMPGWPNMILRAIVFCILGAGLGAGIGFSTFVTKRGLQGLVGGAVGGFVAGILFDPVGAVLGGLQLTAQGVGPGQVGETGAISRGLTGVLMGGMIALMIGLVEAIAKSAWVRLELGRNEGKDWVIDKPVMTIGRFERADIPLFGDVNVATQHAVIERQGSQYFFVDLGSPLGSGVNGQRVQRVPLNNGDVIQIGSNNLRFQLKGHAAPKRGPEPGRGPISGTGVGYQTSSSQVGGSVITGLPSQMGQPMPTAMNLPPTQSIPAQSVLNPTIVAPVNGLCLLVTSGPMAGQRFSLPVELGRESVQIPMGFDSMASRRHARIEPSGMMAQVVDLGSTNGTFINGVRIQQQIAKIGDEIKVGSTTFRIESQ